MKNDTEHCFKHLRKKKAIKIERGGGEEGERGVEEGGAEVGEGVLGRGGPGM